ncbi:fructose-bisphosphate aldolase-like [Polistes fuscatus]|uniref:fructose-bisphosphate aldolase-like n=1 Tax=Polistes fuscatus TaxID=30207 RepID=UPI001CA8CE82|nr:fructose-bisphosphate aldolase-like [Polistes fuscatus]XP_043499973.1 fructose-bisphosphate aldolase-like [Polistes fuscatus]
MVITILLVVNKFLDKKPWSLTFSYSRALQASVLRAWAGKTDQVTAGQEELIKRTKANSESALSKYAGGVTCAAGGAALFVANHAY